MAQQTVVDGETGLSHRTKVNDNFTELYNYTDGTTPLTAVDINGGTIDGATVGSTTPSTGVFTTLAATSIDSTPIGGTTPASGAFTTLSATSMDSTPIGGTTPESGTFSTLATTGDTLTIQTTKTPATATDTGTTGQIAWDSSYIYVCIATNTWVRSALTTW